MARSLHFLGGDDVLLVTYMDHGVMCALVYKLINVNVTKKLAVHGI